MSLDELRKLEEAERQLQEQLSKLQEEKERIKRELPLVINVAMSNSPGIISLMADYREDIVEEYKKTPGRMFVGRRENTIPIGSWKSLQERLLNLPRVQLEFAAGAKELIENYKEPPQWRIDVTDKSFVIVPGARARTNLIYQIPGSTYATHGKHYNSPLTEGWRIFQVFGDLDNVEITDRAKEIIQNQIELRGKLDTIATTKDFPELIDRFCEIDDHACNIAKMMRPFQRVGVGFLEANGGRGIIGDEMGLGKTWQAVMFAELIKAKKVLVICPASLKPNWAREIRNLANENPYPMFGSKPTNFDIQKLIINPSRYSLMNYDIISRGDDVRTEDERGVSQVRKRWWWAELINLAKFDLIICDEGHYIKNIDSNRSQAVRTLKADRVVFLTGTPVLNRPGELWAMLNVLRPDQFPYHETFLKQYTWDGKTARNVNELREILKTIMIRRTKKDVIKELPPINRINDYHELSAKARKVYDKVLTGVWEVIDAYSPGSGGNQMGITSILAQITRLKQVCAIDKVERTAELAQELYESGEEDENRKVIVFTQFKGTANKIRQLLGHEAVGFVSWTKGGFKTADIGERDRLVQQFQTDPNVKYIVVTEKTAREGHNMTAAGHVIFNDLFWTPANHQQAEGRAYGRLQDLHSINSYYLITDMDGQSIEEWIMDLLAAKLAVIEEVVEGVESSRDASIAMELISKLKEARWRK